MIDCVLDFWVTSLMDWFLNKNNKNNSNCFYACLISYLIDWLMGGCMVGWRGWLDGGYIDFIALFRWLINSNLKMQCSFWRNCFVCTGCPKWKSGEIEQCNILGDNNYKLCVKFQLHYVKRNLRYKHERNDVKKGLG